MVFWRLLADVCADRDSLLVTGANADNPSRPRKASDTQLRYPKTHAKTDDTYFCPEPKWCASIRIYKYSYRCDKHQRSSHVEAKTLVSWRRIQQDILISKNTDLPLSLAILLDTSRSEVRTLFFLLAAARSFLEEVMRPNRDEAAIISFTGEVTLEQGLTGNKSRLRDAIERVTYTPPSGMLNDGVVVSGTPPISGRNQELAAATAIWDAVWATSNELLSDTAEHTVALSSSH